MARYGRTTKGTRNLDHSRVAGGGTMSHAEIERRLLTGRHLPSSGSGVGASTVTGATVTVRYGLIGHDSSYGFSGEFALPVGRSDYHEPAFVHVVVTLPDGSVDEVCPPIPAGTTTFEGLIKYPQDGVTHDLTIEFLSENEDGAITDPGYSVPVTILASAVVSVVGREVPNALSVDEPTRLVSTTIGATPTFANDQVPKTVSFLLSEDAGATFVSIGKKIVTTVGEEIQFQRVKPTTTKIWKVAMVAGYVDGDASKRIPAIQLPAGSKVSAGFAVGSLAVPSANLISGLNVTMGDGSTLPYNQHTSDGEQYFSIAEISLDDRGCLADPNAFYVRVTAQDLDANHQPIWIEKPFAGAVVSGATQTFGPLMGAYGTQGDSYTRSGNVAYVRLKAWVCNRINQTATSFSDSTTATLQTGVGGGLGYVDVLVASGGAVPAITALTAREVPNSLTVDPITRLVSTTVGATPTFNGSVPQAGTYLLSEDNGVTFVYLGWRTVKQVGEEIQFGRVKPTSPQTWKVAMVAGIVGGDASKRIPAAQLPAGSKVSAGFAVGSLAVPAANLISTLLVSAGAGGNFPYNQTTPDGTQYFSIAQISLDDSGCLVDPNAFYVRVTAQDLDAAHSPVGLEGPFDGSVVDGSVHTFGPLAGAYGTTGFSYTRSGNGAYVRLKVYVCNRVNQTATSFSDPATATLQTGVGSGVGFVDVLFAAGGALPTGQIPGPRVKGKLPGPTLPLGGDTTLTLDGSGNVIVNQPAMVISNLTGNLSVARVSNLTSIFISSLTGNLDVTRVTNLNLLSITTFSGNLDVSRVTNLGSIAIGTFTGNLDVSRITNLNTLLITSFSGNLDISRVTNITSINIGTLSGTLNVTYQVADGSIPINKIATLYVSNLQGWDGASITVGNGGMTFTGEGGVVVAGMGNVNVMVGRIKATGADIVSAGYGFTIHGGPFCSLSGNSNSSVNVGVYKVNGVTGYTGTITVPDGYGTRWSLTYNSGILTSVQTI